MKLNKKKFSLNHIPAPSFDGGLQEDDGVDGIHECDLGVAHELGVALILLVRRVSLSHFPMFSVKQTREKYRS